jgi:acetoin utilization deacetylase AcuC-like enzyme
VWKELEDAGLIERTLPLEPAMASDEQILAVHEKDYLDLLDAISEEPYGVRFDADTYALPVSPGVARLSAGGVIRAVDAVLTGKVDNALAVTRPPGHHAIPSRGMGFCLLANVAMAARHAQRSHGVKRVMIVDYDVHHGNGTQDIFYEDGDVLFFSTHQYPFYPGTGGVHETGRGAGRGTTVNVPLGAGHGDSNYARVYKEILWPVARRFKPELILVSAGFDAHWIDPLASMSLSLHGYAHLDRELIAMADELSHGRIVFVMEGGYDLDALAHGVRNIAHALLREDEISDPLRKNGQREPEIDRLIAQLRELHDV